MAKLSGNSKDKIFFPFTFGCKRFHIISACSYIVPDYIIFLESRNYSFLLLFNNPHAFFIVGLFERVAKIISVKMGWTKLHFKFLGCVIFLVVTWRAKYLFLFGVTITNLPPPSLAKGEERGWMIVYEVLRTKIRTVYLTFVHISLARMLSHDPGLTTNWAEKCSLSVYPERGNGWVNI